MIDLFNRRKVRDLETRIAALESNESFTPYQIGQISERLLNSNYLLLVTANSVLDNTDIIIPPDKKGIVVIGNNNTLQNSRIKFAKYKIVVEEPNAT